ncbi:hypothetical protein HDU92_002969 [Lobulomyces angularis]|nr:hypothetical protein HDU92_002969 [Lobulomyces angularis]
MTTHSSEFHFENIILGTGLTNSILAGALAKQNSKTLHLDKNDFYGETGQSNNPAEILKCLLNSSLLIKINDEQILKSFEILGDTSELQSFLSTLNGDERMLVEKLLESNAIQFVEEIDFLQKKNKEEILIFKFRVLLLFLKDLRRTSLDLDPNVLRSNSSMVELLVKSGVGRYMEFKALEKIFLLFNDSVIEVPQSKEGIFSDSKINLRDKRKLMKFLNLINNAEELNAMLEEFGNTPFQEFLTSKGLDAKMIKIVLHALSFVIDGDESIFISTKDGVCRLTNYMKSIGMFGGSTGYIVNIYGLVSELYYQLFRYAAVNGCTYILRSDIKSVTHDNEKGTYTIAFMEENTKYTCNRLISSLEYMNLISTNLDVNVVYNSRAIVLQKKVEDENYKLTVFPPEAEHQGVVSFEQPLFANVAGIEICVNYFTSRGVANNSTPESDLNWVFKNRTSQDDYITIFYKEQSKRFNGNCKDGFYFNNSNLFVIENTLHDYFQFENNLNTAKQLFSKIKPEGEFFPKFFDLED